MTPEQIQKEAGDRYPNRLDPVQCREKDAYIAGRTVNIERERGLERLLQDAVDHYDMSGSGEAEWFHEANKLLTPKQSDNGDKRQC